MTYKTILVQIDSDRLCEERLRYACELAHGHGAHLVGLHLSGPALGTLAYDDYAGSFRVWHEEKDSADRRSAELQALFERLTVQWDLIGTEWRRDQGDPLRAAMLHARYADLLVMGQPDPDDPGNRFARPFPALVALGAGRPVLVTPHGHGLSELPGVAIVAWDRSREAALAATCALPLLTRAERVVVLAIGDHDGDDGFAVYLSRHGIKAEFAHESGGDVSAGDILLSRASDWNARLLVAGAYGHSRVSEWAFGGVTRQLLSSMTLPVLLAH